MRKIFNTTAILLIGFLATQCSGEDENLEMSSASLQDGGVTTQVKPTESVLIGTPLFNKPAIDSGNVFNQTFHPGDTVFVNGVNLGGEGSVSTLDLYHNGFPIGNLPLDIAAPFVRGSFIVPQVPNGSYLVMLRIDGVSKGTHTEGFSIIN